MGRSIDSLYICWNLSLLKIALSSNCDSNSHPVHYRNRPVKKAYKSKDSVHIWLRPVVVPNHRLRK